MREARIITEGSPCHVDFSDDSIQTIEQAQEMGPKSCDMAPRCERQELHQKGIRCLAWFALLAARACLEGSSVSGELREVREAIFDMKKNGDKHVDPFDEGIEVDITDVDEACNRVDRYARNMLDLRPGDELFDRVYGPYTTQPNATEENYPILNGSVWDGDTKVYIHTCGGFLAEADIAHPIHDGPFPGSGGGSVYTEYAPFCPRCGKRPSFHGSPVKEDPRERKELDFLQKGFEST